MPSNNEKLRQSSFVSAKELDPAFFAALSDHNRLKILLVLHNQKNPLTVQELIAIVGIRKENASQHLAKLRNAGLIEYQKQGKFRFYSLCRSVAREKLEAALLAFS